MRALCLIVILASRILSAPAADQRDFFESKIRPVLAAECYECHGPTKQKHGLRLDYRDGMLQGGESGAAIVPGDVSKSLLVQAIRHTHAEIKMPKDRAKLDARIIANFETWIGMGAPDPRDHPPTAEEAAKEMDWKSLLAMRKQWWCFQPVADPGPPVVKNPGWSQHPVDRFVLKKIEDAGLQPGKRAHADTLIRRISYVLTGMPPTPEEVESFEKSANRNPQAAVESLVERVLNSPRFGEAWARHWMDWMRYAESHGSEGDPAIPYAWRYRDYLIRALNEDVPFPQLLREHIAGDLLLKPRINAELGINESALGIGHYRMVLHGFSPTDTLDEQVSFTDNQVDVLSKAFLGLTVSCARCHNHKFDAISQTDFYALYGIMASCRPATIDVDVPAVQKKSCEVLAALKPRIRDAVASEWLKSLDALPARLGSWKPAAATARKGREAPAPDPSFAAWLRLLDADAETMKAEWAKLDDDWRRTKLQLAAFAKTDAFARWDLRGGDAKRWFANGNGISGPGRAGEFSIACEDETVIGGIHPAGVFTDNLSTKHRGVFASPRFKAEGGKLWVRVAGDGGARVRYVVENYPRSGTVHLKKDLDGGAGEWVSWDLDYWKGDMLYLEACTNADMPLEGRQIERSWFGISEVIYARNKETAPPPTGIAIHAILGAKAPAPGTRAELAQAYVKAVRICLEAWKAGTITDEQAEFLNAFVRNKLLPNTIEELPESATLIAKYREIESAVPVPTRAPGVLEADAFDQALFVRGNHKQPSEAVPRRFLEAIDAKAFKPRNSGRLQLAESLVSPQNPLTSRVIVNRIWHHVFGRGIVATTDNFGKLGELPTHPELLDYLATRFLKRGGSIKDMLRLLLISQTFQLEDHAPPGAAEKDPDNLLLSHFSVRRLEAEAIRDSILALSGKLDGTLFGESVPGGESRRSVYVKVIRNSLDPFLGVFDAPVPSTGRGRRDSTNVPAQSLALLNDSAVIKWSEAWAKRIVASAGDGHDDARVERMFREAFNRAPTREEISRSLAYLRAISRSGDDALAELAKIQQKESKLHASIEAVLAPMREKLGAGHDSALQIAGAPVPLAEWDFEDGGKDLRGALDLELKGGARIEHGALILDGDKSYAESKPLSKTLREKTLEAWVQLDDLEQRGGGVITVQTRDGSIFDSIVFGEKEAKCWLPGSDHFTRTASLDGEPERVASDKPVHVAIVYRADGTITGYRDGKSYGQGYQSKRLQSFDEGACNVVFGMRHAPAGGNKMLRGRIVRARLYDRALGESEVAASSMVEVPSLRDDDLLASLDRSHRTGVQEARGELKQLNLLMGELRQAVTTSGPEAAWKSLAQSLINLKEFIYLR